MKSLIMRISAAAVFTAAFIISAAAQKPVLKFNGDGKFKIVQFTDTHVIYGDERSDVAMERMNEVLDAEKPDFVIYTGDVIFGTPAKESLFQALEPVISRGIPFGVTWGNHDDEQSLTRKELFDLIKEVPANLTETVEGISGVTNYILPIKSHNNGKDAFVLYIIDSNSYSTEKEVDGYGWVAFDQVQWYRNQSEALTESNSGNPLPALAFMHIPLPEYHDANCDGSSFFMGSRKENASAPKLNSGLALAMLESKDVMGVFAGHDHVNDYIVEWNGMILGFGRYTGGSTVYNDIHGGNGARVFELTEGERAFRTWVRLKGGKVIYDFNYPEDLMLDY